MNIKMGSQTFQDVTVPLLWGTRAVLVDKKGRLSVIDLEGASATAEIVGDKPAPKVDFLPTTAGFDVIRKGVALYNYDVKDRILTSHSLGLPPVHIGQGLISVGGNVFEGTVIQGFGVGISVQPDGIAMGSQLPANLARLVV
jgi:hypothetical protein